MEDTPLMQEPPTTEGEDAGTAPAEVNVQNIVNGTGGEPDPSPPDASPTSAEPDVPPTVVDRSPDVIVEGSSLDATPRPLPSDTADSAKTEIAAGEDGKIKTSPLLAALAAKNSSTNTSPAGDGSAAKPGIVSLGDGGAKGGRGFSLLKKVVRDKNNPYYQWQVSMNKEEYSKADIARYQTHTKTGSASRSSSKDKALDPPMTAQVSSKISFQGNMSLDEDRNELLEITNKLRANIPRLKQTELTPNELLLDYSIILILHNPEHESAPQNRPISKEEAMRLYNEIFPPLPHLMAGFEKAWESLKNFEEDDGASTWIPGVFSPKNRGSSNSDLPSTMVAPEEGANNVAVEGTHKASVSDDFQDASEASGRGDSSSERMDSSSERGQYNVNDKSDNFLIKGVMQGVPTRTRKSKQKANFPNLKGNMPFAQRMIQNLNNVASRYLGKGVATQSVQEFPGASKSSYPRKIRPSAGDRNEDCEEEHPFSVPNFIESNDHKAMTEDSPMDDGDISHKLLGRNVSNKSKLKPAKSIPGKASPFVSDEQLLRFTAETPMKSSSKGSTADPNSAGPDVDFNDGLDEGVRKGMPLSRIGKTIQNQKKMSTRNSSGTQTDIIGLTGGEDYRLSASSSSTTSPNKRRIPQEATSLFAKKMQADGRSLYFNPNKDRSMGMAQRKERESKERGENTPENATNSMSHADSIVQMVSNLLPEGLSKSIFKEGQHQLPYLDEPDKCFSRGGSFQKMSDGSFAHHLDPQMNCRDLLTLIRNTLVYVLVYECDFTVDMFFSPDFTSIYILVVADAQDISAQAEKSQYLTKINWERVDPEAYEPHDRSYRTILSHFQDSCDPEVYAAYAAMVTKFKKNSHRVPPEVVAYHVNKLAKYKRNIEKAKADVTRSPEQSPANKFKRQARALVDGMSNVDGVGAIFKMKSDASARKEQKKSQEVEKRAQNALAKHGCNAEEKYSVQEIVEKFRASKAKASGTSSEDKLDEKALNKVLKNMKIEEVTWNELKLLYITYLENRTAGLTSFRSMYEANRDLATHTHPLKLQSLWGRLGMSGGPTTILHPFTTAEDNIPWQRYTVKNVHGKTVRTFFSPSDRLQIMSASIERFIDLPDLITLDGGTFLKDYFPIDDPKLKEACMVPYDEFLLRGDDVPISSINIPICSRYFLEESEIRRVEERRKRFKELNPKLEAIWAEKLVTLKKPAKGANAEKIQEARLNALCDNGWFYDIGGVPHYFADEQYKMTREYERRLKGGPKVPAPFSPVAAKTESTRKTDVTGKTDSMGKSESSKTDGEKSIIPRFIENGRVFSTGYMWPTFYQKYMGVRMEQEYFGQKIGLYFLFSKHITLALIIPLYFGFVATIFQAIAETNDDKDLRKMASEGISLLNAIFLSIWASHVIDSWEMYQKRKLLQYNGILPSIAQAAVAKQAPIPRKRFVGRKIKSPITGDVELQFPRFQRTVRLIISNMISGLAFIGVMVAVVFISAVRNKIYKYCWLGFVKFNYAQNIIGMFNAGVIIFFNILYGQVGLLLTQFENHRDYKSFLNSYAVKISMFQFLNCYSSLIYIAYFMKVLEEQESPADGPNRRILLSSCEWFSGGHCFSEVSTEMFYSLSETVSMVLHGFVYYLAAFLAGDLEKIFGSKYGLSGEAAGEWLWRTMEHVIVPFLALFGYETATMRGCGASGDPSSSSEYYHSGARTTSAYLRHLNATAALNNSTATILPGGAVSGTDTKTTTLPTTVTTTTTEENICSQFKPSVIFGQTCQLSMTNKQLVSLILVFCARNFVEIGKPLAKQWWKERESRKAMEKMEKEEKAEKEEAGKPSAGSPPGGDATMTDGQKDEQKEGSHREGPHGEGATSSGEDKGTIMAGEGSEKKAIGRAQTERSTHKKSSNQKEGSHTAAFDNIIEIDDTEPSIRDKSPGPSVASPKSSVEGCHTPYSVVLDGTMTVARKREEQEQRRIQQRHTIATDKVSDVFMNLGGESDHESSRRRGSSSSEGYHCADDAANAAIFLGKMTSAKTQHMKSLASEIQEQEVMEPYGDSKVGFDGTIEDYSEFAVMFGFLVLFSISFPLIAVLIWGACLMEIYVDDWKLKYIVRRPFPTTSYEGIGIWVNIFKGLVWASIPFNACLLVVTAEVYKSDTMKAFIGDNPSVMAVWFMVTFFLGVIKAIASFHGQQDHTLPIITTRVHLFMKNLTLPEQEKKDEEGFDEATDFRVKQPDQTNDTFGK